MTTKHTKGPWLAASHPSSLLGWPVVGHRARAICSVHMRKGETEEGCQINAEAGANAKLIAAAPELLEALEAYLAVEADREGIRLPCYEKAAAAVSKATLGR